MKKTLLIIVLFIIHFGIQAQTVINAGVGGNSTVDLLKRIDQDVLSHKPNLVILMVGTNDMLNSKKMISYADYQQNLNQIMIQIKKSGAQVLMMSSPTADSTYLFQRHDKSKFLETPNEKIDSIMQIAKVVVTQNSALFFDLNLQFKKLGLPRHNQDLFIRNEKNSGRKDGVHPTSLGYHFIAANMFVYLKEQGLISKELKIVCFGDSITNGKQNPEKAHYPGYLQEMLINYFQ